MPTKSTGDASIDALYKARGTTVSFVDVPEFGFVMVDGSGAPGGPDFAAALQALYTVSYAAHFAVKRTVTHNAPRVMPLEALWWVEDEQAQAVMARIASGEAGIEQSDRSVWQWRAMILQLAPIDAATVDRAITEAKGKKKNIAALDLLRYERWREGPSAQIMHIGPYATEVESVVALHKAIAAHGARPRGRHHEIYLGDPRTCAPEKLRTILRQPIEPAR